MFSIYGTLIIVIININHISYEEKQHHIRAIWRNNLTKSNTMWMDYNQINLWVVTGGILQLFIRKKINFKFNFQRDMSFWINLILL
jgi:hypothetical protein